MTVRSVVLGSLLAALGTPVPAAAQGKLLHHAIDRQTGSIVRVFKTGDGARVELESPSLKVTREAAGARVTTTLTDSGGVVSVTYDRRTLTVKSPAGRVTATPQQAARMEQARQLIASAPVTARAAALIERLGFGADNPVLPLLLTTRTFLAAVSGRPVARDLRFALPVVSTQPRLMRVSLEQQSSSSMTPTECWNAYAKEAIEAYKEYEECISDKAWWEILDNLACGAIYDMRAIGAFTWWMKCVAIN
jgi:hypothetical protein